MMFIIYTTPHCSDCLRVKNWLAENHYLPGRDFQEIDLSEQPQYLAKVEAINNGLRSTPTLVFPDGSSLTEPSIEQIKQKLQVLKP
jgi:mycoredoxin